MTGTFGVIGCMSGFQGSSAGPDGKRSGMLPYTIQSLKRIRKPIIGANTADISFDGVCMLLAADTAPAQVGRETVGLLTAAEEVVSQIGALTFASNAGNTSCQFCLSFSPWI